MSEENIKLLKKAGLKITEPRLTILALMQNHKNEHFLQKMYIRFYLNKVVKLGLQRFIVYLINLTKHTF